MATDWASKQVELSRELISLARQGGASLEEIRERKRAAAQAAKEEAQKEAEKASKTSSKKTPGKAPPGKPPAPPLAKSASAPSLTQQAAASTARPVPGLSALKSMKSAAGTMRTTAGAQSTVRSSMGTRRGGGWVTKNGDDELAKMREKIDEILGNRSDIDYCEEPYLRSALWEASWKNHEAVVRLLASKGARVCHTDYQGRTPLHEAAFYGHTNILQFLIDSGHPINCADAFGQTPLFRAVEGGRHDAIRLLVENGAHTNTVDEHGCTVQHLASFRGDPLLSHFLLNNGAYRNRFSLEELPGQKQGGSSPSLSLISKGSQSRLGGALSRQGSKASLKAGATLMFA